MGTTTELKSSSRTARARRQLAKQKSPGLDDWEGWCKHLQGRKKPVSLTKLIPHLSTPILSWPLKDAWHGSESEKLVNLLERYARGNRNSHAGIPEQLEAWLDEAPSRSADEELAIECIAWCHVLPRLTEWLPAAPWCQLLDTMQGLAEQAAGLDPERNPLIHQLLAGELPLSLGFVLPELAACRELVAGACHSLSQVIVDLTDGEGLLAARYLNAARPLLACWTRCGYIGRRLGETVFDAQAQTQLDWLVLQTLRLSRLDGSQVLSSGLSTAYCGPLFDAALTLTDDPVDRVVASHVLSRSPGKRPRALRKKLPSTSVSSEWAEIALLRRTWDRQSHQLAVTYQDQQISWELNAAGTTWWSGAGNPDIKVDGETLELTGQWEEVCSVANEEADYVELEMSLDGGRSLQRQLLMARGDRFLFVADVLLGGEEAEIEYGLNILLAPSIDFCPQDETREGTLVGKRCLGNVLPLALPEWRSERVTGSLEQREDGLHYQLKARGRRLYAPLFVDLDSSRARRKLTWRRLTTAEQLEVQPQEVAVAYRVQIGEQQWIVYRSLTPPANRSFLGQNVSSEFIVGRFTRDGEISELIEIE